MFGFKKEEQLRTPHVAELSDTAISKPRKLYRNMVRTFKAAATSRLNSKWPSTPINADHVVERSQRILVARSREQCSNNDYAKKLRTNGSSERCWSNGRNLTGAS